MKKVTPLLALLLALLMILSLGACTKTGTTSSPSGSAKASAAPSAAPSTPASAAASAPEKATASPSASGQQPKSGGSITIGWRNMPPDLFFIKNHSLSIYFIAPCVETLARLVNNTNDWKPFLADSLTSDLTNNTFTIKLKQGIKFHDGSELTADVVKWNFQYMIDNKQASYLGSPTGFDVPDKYTLVVKFAAPSVNWAELLGQIPIYSKDAFDKNGPDYMLKHPVGTGPFVFKDFVPDSSITYVKNTNYWQKGLPYLDQWKIQAIADPAAQMAAFKNKEVDFMTITDPPTVDSMIASGFKNKHIDNFAAYTTYGIYPNSKVEGDPWYKTEVRQAVLLYGIDWDAVALLSGGKTAKKALQQDIAGALCYIDGLDAKAAYDVNKAKTMLTAAGYPNGFSTKIYSPVTTTAAATAVQDQLKKLNITAEIVKVQPNDTSRTDGKTPGLSMVMLTTAYDIIYKSFTMFFNKDSISYGANILYSDKFNEAYAKALVSKTWEERAQNGKTCAQLLYFDECKLRMMYMTSDAYFVQDYLHGSNYEYGLEIFNVTPDTAWISK